MFSVKGSKFGSPLSQLKESLMMMMDLEDLFPQNNIFFNDMQYINQIISLIIFEKNYLTSLDKNINN